jgi:CheY-like chemotaxis protein
MIRVLIVESDGLVRDVVAERLESAGFEVGMCPGPSGPDYTCLGSRGGTCPLEQAADVVVLDAEIPGEDVPDSASGVELLSYYVGAGKPVIAMRAGSEMLRMFEDDQVHGLGWPPDRDALVQAIEKVAPSESTAGGATGGS